MKFVPPLLVLAVAAVLWNALRTTTVSLQADLALAHERQRAAGALRAELDRLQQRVPTPDEWAQLRRAADECAELNRRLGARPTLTPAPVPTLSTGEWFPVGAWKDRGHATPAAALETTLWAAAGGDLTSLGNLLLLDDTVLAQAADLLARLPESSRRLYSTPEHLIAAVTARAIPLGDAQLVWQQSSGPDDATACLFLRDPRGGMEPVGAASFPPAASNAPPMQPSAGTSKSIVLSLRRANEGWRIVVPAGAIARISRDLTGPK